MAWGRRPTRVWPSSRISPSSGLSSPVIRLKKVVLPDEADDAGRRDHQLHVAHRDETAEAPRQAAHLEDGQVVGGPASRGGRFPQPGRQRVGARAGRGGHQRLHLFPLVHVGRGRAHAAAHQPLRADQHDDHQAQAEEEPAPQGEVDGSERRDAERAADPAHQERHLGEEDPVEEGDEHAAQDHALEAAHASQDDHAQQHDRDVELEGARRDGLQLGRVERAGEAGEGGAEREGEQLGLDRVDPGAVGGRLVLADGHPGPPEPGVPHPVHGPERKRPDDQDEEVPRDEVGIEIDEGQMRAADRVHPVLAAGKIEPLDGPPPPDVDGDVAHVADGDGNDLAESEGDDGQIVAAHPQGRRPDHQAEPGRDGGGDPDDDPEAPHVPIERRAEHRRVEQAHGVGADGEERGVAQVEHSRVTHHDVEPEGEEDVDHGVGDRVHRLRLQPAVEEGIAEERGNEEGGGNHPAGAGGAHALSGTFSPSSPWGRKIRTRIRIEKTMAFVQRAEMY